MKEAAALPEALHGSVFLTSFQTGGRGRGRSRSWYSDRGRNLLLTLVIDPEKIAHPPVRVPLICALALLDMLHAGYGIEGLLKWPNDVLVDGKKISGILCEYREGRILAGIGINVGQTEFPPELEKMSTSMAKEGINDVPPADILVLLLESLNQRLNNPEWKKDAEARLYGRYQVLKILEGGTENPVTKEIIIDGLDENGFLIVNDPQSGLKKHVNAGEISFQGFGEFR